MSLLSAFVSPKWSGDRLDRFLVCLFPETGLRYRRRLCEEQRIFVNGKARGAAFKVQEGSFVEVQGQEHRTVAHESSFFVIDKNDHFAAVFKPHGMHSAAIAGKENLNVEAALGQLFPASRALLLNRLDSATSGLLLVALTEQAHTQYMAAQEQGKVCKYYCARVQGNVERSLLIKQSLDTEKRKRTKVLPELSSDSTRWTLVEPLQFIENQNISLVRCMIKKGARHQIRVHMASQGHPLVGDSLYGGPLANRLFLHHYAVVGPDFSFEIPEAF